jgi:hypothetical protein
MTDKEKKHEEEDYKLPPGIILPQDDTPDYPNWKKGILCGIPSGLLGAFILAVAPLAKQTSGKVGYAVLGFFMVFIMVAGLVAFRPPKA